MIEYDPVNTRMSGAFIHSLSKFTMITYGVCVCILEDLLKIWNPLKVPNKLISFIYMCFQ
jgi:hypothetical protein